MTTAIIGAGISGLSAARQLLDLGESVVLYDKGRGAGGRLSTRRVDRDDEQIQFDHGAPAFTARSFEFQSQLNAWQTAGLVARWDGRFVRLSSHGEGVEIPKDASPWVGVPRMSALVKSLASDVHVQWSTRVEEIIEGRNGFRLTSESGDELGLFERVIVAVPAEQAGDLLDAVAPDLAGQARRIVSDPCWSVMCVFPESARPDWAAVELQDHPVQFACHNSSKPQRTDRSSWVLQASPDWSRQHLEDSPDEVSRQLVTAFCERTGFPAPVVCAVHRWRYARPVVAAPVERYWRNDFRIGVCGDWCVDGSVEGAWLSAQKLVAGLER